MGSEDLDFLEQPQALDKEALATLQDKLSRLRKKRDRIAELEEKLKAIKAEERSLSMEEVPNFLQQFGISGLSLETGERLTIKEDIEINIPKKDPAKRTAVFKWFRAHGGGGLIKDTLVTEDPTVGLLELLEAEEVPYQRTLDMNANRAKAYLRSLLGLTKGSIATIQPNEAPAELNLFIIKQTIIKE